MSVAIDVLANALVEVSRDRDQWRDRAQARGTADVTLRRVRDYLKTAGTNVDPLKLCELLGVDPPTKHAIDQGWCSCVAGYTDNSTESCGVCRLAGCNSDTGRTPCRITGEVVA
jgi:hypothetical protein